MKTQIAPTMIYTAILEALLKSGDNLSIQSDQKKRESGKVLDADRIVDSLNQVILTAEYEVAAKDAEIHRHHEDFEKISLICDIAFDQMNLTEADSHGIIAINALKKIRNIVG